VAGDDEVEEEVEVDIFELNQRLALNLKEGKNQGKLRKVEVKKNKERKKWKEERKEEDLGKGRKEGRKER